MGDKVRRVAVVAAVLAVLGVAGCGPTARACATAGTVLAVNCE